MSRTKKSCSTAHLTPARSGLPLGSRLPAGVGALPFNLSYTFSSGGFAMHYHPETLFVLHKERQDRLEVDAARYALMKGLRRRRKRLRPSRPVPVRLKPLLR